MAFKIEKRDADKISEVLGKKCKEFADGWSWKIIDEASGQSLAITIYKEVELGGDEIGSLISAQSQHGYFELHNPSAYMTFEPDEIIFININDNKMSSLIVGKSATCSMYANINRDILSADITTLDPATLLAAMQLSITETIAEFE